MISHWVLLMVVNSWGLMNPIAKGQKPHGRRPQCENHPIGKCRVAATKCVYKPPRLIMVKTLWWRVMLGWSWCVSDCLKRLTKGKIYKVNQLHTLDKKWQR